MSNQTLVKAGFKFPAEWEKHRATWIGWCSNASDFPGKIAAIHWVYGEITRKLIEGRRNSRYSCAGRKTRSESAKCFDQSGRGF